MKQPTAVLIAIIVIAAACTAILAMRKDLCEIHIRSGQTEVAVFMAYESK
ncbi:Hok/Gef family protein [Rahnella sp. ChDrAdgB13]|nr:Hok/Gef family protein [Rahnella sp. ChDrAdgB13]